MVLVPCFADLPAADRQRLRITTDIRHALPVRLRRTGTKHGTNRVVTAKTRTRSTTLIRFGIRPRLHSGAFYGQNALTDSISQTAIAMPTLVVEPMTRPIVAPIAGFTDPRIVACSVGVDFKRAPMQRDIADLQFAVSMSGVMQRNCDKMLASLKLTFQRYDL